MAVTPIEVVRPFVLKTAKATFAIIDPATGDPGTVQDWSLHIGELTLTPSTQSGSWTGISGNVVSDLSIATWAAQFGLIQDLDDSGFLRWLLEEEGSKAEVVVTFASGADPCTFVVTLTPSTLGGAVGPNPLSGTVTMSVDGRPVFG